MTRTLTLADQATALSATTGDRPQSLLGKRVAAVTFSHYPSDPRPRRAAELMREEGMVVDVICLRQDSGETRRETFNGVNILRMPLRHKRGGKLGYMFKYGFFLFAAWGILAWRTFSRRRYDVVHIHNMPDVLVFAAMVPKLFGAKVILDLHDPMPELMMTIFGSGKRCLVVRVLEWLERASICFANSVLTVNMTCKKIFEERSASAGKITVVMNSPDEGIFPFRDSVQLSPGYAARPFVLMYHGSVVERHGLDLAVKAVEMLKPKIPTIELRVFGRSTPFLEKVRAYVKQADLGKNVKFLGGKKLEEIAAAIDECDLGLIPNRRSIFTEINMPTRIFEYLSRGKPVIAPAAIGIQDYFNEDQLIYFQLGDAVDLARRIEYVYLHPQEAASITKRGMEVYAGHRWSSERQKLIDCVRRLV